MNILHISSAKNWRGGERQVYYLIHDTSNTGFKNYLMSPSQSELSNRVTALITNHLVFKKGIFGLLLNARALNIFCKQHSIQIIHGHDSHAHSLLWIAYRFFGLSTKSVITRRLINPIKSRSLKKYNYPKIEKIICISNAVFSSLSKGIKDINRLKIIHSGIDLSGIPSPEDKNKESTFFNVGYVAAFTKEKDHDTFLKCAIYLLENFKEIPFKFILAGDGPQFSIMKSLTKDHVDQFEFRGFIEDIDLVYSELNILLHPSRSEALGTAILDAMKFSIPVVATDVGGIPEIVDHGKTGFLFEVGDYLNMAKAIVMLYQNPILYNEMVERSFEKVKQFDKQKMIEDTTSLYLNLI